MYHITMRNISLIALCITMAITNTSDNTHEVITNSSMPPLFYKNGTPHTALKQLLTYTDIPLHEKPDSESYQQYILRRTQGEWLRRPDQERWHMNQAITKNHSEILTQLHTLGVTQHVIPERTQYDAIGVLGAAAPRLRDRIQHAVSVYKNGTYAPRFIIFTGDRPRSQERETRDVLASCCDTQFPLGDNEHLPESETEIAHFLLKHMDIPQHMPEIQIISAPRHADGSRPNTRDTITHWHTQNTNQVTSLLCISNQPYVRYQDTVVRSALLSHMHIETVGSVISSQEPTQVLLDTVARWIYAHGNQK